MKQKQNKILITFTTNRTRKNKLESIYKFVVCYVRLLAQSVPQLKLCSRRGEVVDDGVVVVCGRSASGVGGVVGEVMG